MTSAVAIIGFGEAARAFTGDDGWHGRARTFDIKTDDPAQAGAMRQAYAVHDVTGTDTLAACLDGAAAIISLVTADQALGVARDAARLCPPGTFFFDFNSVAPGTKIRAMEAIAAAGGVYVDVAVMSPVNPARLDTPLLVSGADPDGACDHLRSVGFRNVTAVSATVGDASSIKMIRSVMIKGIEALTAECMIAARKAGVLDDVLASLGGDWPARADYNLDRMMVHGTRRAAEMREVAATLDALGLPPRMTAGTIAWQDGIGALGLAPPADGLAAKLDTLLPAMETDPRP